MKINVKYSAILLISAIFLLFFSCKKEQTMPPPHLGEDYFPVVKGSWITYRVDSIVWNDFYTPVKIDTFSFYIKMKIDTTFTDNEGRTAYVWRKFYKNDTSDWILMKNYSITKLPERIETYEENIRFIKMVFPIKYNISWDLNAMNTYKATSSYYDNYDSPFSVDGTQFDSCATVIHKNLETLISKDYHKEVFAKHTGLIFKEITKLTKEVSGQWSNGYSYSYVFINKGKD